MRNGWDEKFETRIMCDERIYWSVVQLKKYFSIVGRGL
jgi:hypothetical protein